MQELRAGSSFAGYRIEQVCGRGGMGVVYRATDPALDRPVALKVIAPELAGNAEFRRRFTVESRIAASLDHPNVIPIYQAGEADGVMFLAMRYVDGHDLRTMIAEGSRLLPQRAARITAQIAAALDAAHDAGLVHRDVKPANVLVTARDHVYLMDFGLTKRLASDHEVTGAGTLLGTLSFVAPEQIRGEEIGPRTDVYALGGTLFQLLTGRIPFPLDTEEGKLWAHLSEPPPLASSVCPDVPSAFDEVVCRAMSKRPEDRFRSAGELGEAAQAAAGPAAPVATRRSVRAARAGPADVAARPLLLRALADPFALVVLAAMLAAGLVVNFAVVLPIALVLYGASVARAYLDEDVRRRVRERRPASGSVDESASGDDVPAPGMEDGVPPPEMEDGLRPPGGDDGVPAPRTPIAELVGEALEKEAQIRQTIDAAPSSEVARELDEFDSAIRRTAAHAEALQNELHDTSAGAIERRIAQLESVGDPRHARLLATLRRQLATRRTMEEHMRLFYEEMNETLNELDSVGSELEATSSVESAQLAADVRDLGQAMRDVDEQLLSAGEPEIPLEGTSSDQQPGT